MHLPLRRCARALARAAFLGLTPAHGLSHLARAVLEGVALSVRHVLEAAETATGAVAGEVRVAGGAGGSAFWNRLKADVLGRTVVQPAVLEAGVLGAALLAAVGVGQFGDPAEAARQMVRVARRHPPGKAAALYDGPFEVFKGLRAALGPGFDRLAPLRGGR
jgi:xylulokinase